MHESVLAFVAECCPDPPPGIRVLDVGSLDVNGSTRPLFPDADYVGLDMRPGPGVDVVDVAANITSRWTANYFDVVLCTEMLEHDPTPWVTVGAMARVVRVGGLVLVTARGVSSARCPDVDRPHAFGAHGEPDDWWRFMPGTLSMLLSRFGLRPLHEHEDPQAPGHFAIAVKDPPRGH